MKKFLRYGSRHRIFFPRGYEGRRWPELNPTSSCNWAGKKRTWSFSEPLWMFLARKRLFAFAGYHRCPERGAGGGAPDSWNFMPDGNRTCSYCGSIHPEDMVRLVSKCIHSNAEEVRIEPSDKKYKTYVWQKGIVNASQGGIKFYMWHTTPDLLLPHSQTAYSLAVKLTNSRYKKEHEERVAAWAAQKK